MHVTLVGTGLSSLLLAEALLRRSPKARLTLVGPRRPLGAHLLSYWSDRPTPFDPFEVASWRALDVFAAGRLHHVPLTRYRYRTVRGRDWAETALARVLASGRAEHVDATALRIDDDLVRPTVVFGGGQVSSDWVFASSADPTATPDAVQQFEGWLVEAQGAGARAPVLMDFRTESAGDLRFVYALPLGPHRLFVEHVSYRPCLHRFALEQYLREVVGLKRWELVDRELGATPLFRDGLPRSEGRVVRIGVAAGLAKASTGYAALRLWRDAEAVAAALAERGELPVRLKWPSLYRVADRFFVDLLRRDPTHLEALLAALFSAADGDAVLAFLDEQAGPAEQARVARAMPEWLSSALLGERP
ncbi:MAG: hypothetical protein IPJ65_40080 [Archangiaceae bacterium]|nr:hypothetical protein [Archangiaceae bacterium]